MIDWTSVCEGVKIFRGGPGARKVFVENEWALGNHSSKELTKFKKNSDAGCQCNFTRSMAGLVA